jgi:CheY-like chemotaxis protein
MNGNSPSYPTQPDGYVRSPTHSDGRVSEDADVRRATARGDESARRLAHELRNCIAPIVNVVHLIKLRGNQDPELSPLIGLIDRQVAAMVRILEIAVDADHAASRTPAASAPVQAIEGNVADERPRGDATFADQGQLTAPDASEALVSRAEAAVPRPGRRILVADDNAAVRNSITAILQDLGHDVRLAANGMEALEMAEQWLPEFVVLDVHMPTISGYDVARRLRTRFAPAVMRLVMLSGTDLDETTLAGAKRAGFDHCIDKVCALKGLTDVLRDSPVSPA